MIINKNEAKSLYYNNLEGYRVEEKIHIENTRWDACYYIIIYHEESGKYYRMYYREGLTEYQDYDIFDFEDEFRLTEVFPRVVQKRIFVAGKDKQ